MSGAKRAANIVNARHSQFCCAVARASKGVFEFLAFDSWSLDSYSAAALHSSAAVADLVSRNVNKETQERERFSFWRIRRGFCQSKESFATRIALGPQCARHRKSEARIRRNRFEFETDDLLTQLTGLQVDSRSAFSRNAFRQMN